MTIGHGFVSLVIALAWSSTAFAQTCLGGPDLATPAVQLRVGGAFTDGARGIVGGLGGGSNRFFSTADIEFTAYDLVDDTEFAFGSVFGTQITTGPQRNVALCPVGAVRFGFGPNPDPVSFRSIIVQGGGSIGVIATTTSTFSVVPTFGIAFTRALATVTLNGISTSDGTNYGVGVIGVGLRFNNHRSAVVPTLSVPFGLNGGDIEFAIRFTTNFW